MGSKEHDSLLCNNKTSDKNNYEAINEFEDLQKKCEDNYAKYLEERENYSRIKKELDVLKEVSGEALGEYENLHRKFAIEQECRDKAEEYAKQQVNENKQLKRQSAMLLNTLVAKAVDFDLEELAGQADINNSSTTEDHGICNKQIEGLKQQVESLQIKTDDLTEKLNITEEKLEHETQEHIKTKEELENNNANFKQLNRVSLLALDDYSNLQQKYEMEIQCRAQAEKLAAEESEENGDKNCTMGNSSVKTRLDMNLGTDKFRRANRDHEAAVKQNEFISKDLSGEERLQKALNEISDLTKKLCEQKTEFDDKVKELEDELASSNDVQKLKSLEEKINTFSQGMETLETRLTQAQQRANDAETKAKKFEDLLKKAQEAPDAPPPPPLPPPPPPPPAPAQLLKKFVGIVSGNKKSLKKSKSSSREDPRIKAMSEMMDRIKSGKVELKKTVPREALSPSGTDGSAMDNLRDVLKAMKRSSSKDENDIKKEDGQQPHNFGVQLRKPAERKQRSLSESDGPDPDFRSLLRKPRSQSTGDMLEDEDDTNMDKDLFELMKKRKAAAERDVGEPKQQNNNAVEKEQEANPTSDEKGKTL